MVNKKRIEIKQEKDVVISMSCDICKKEYFYEDGIVNTGDHIYEMQEFTHIRFTGGYGSVFGDGDSYELDICQHCLKDLVGSHLRLIN